MAIHSSSPAQSGYIGHQQPFKNILMKKVIVVGGGAAGLMAAGQAAMACAEALLLEKMPRPGRKLCITGKGRCNLTNIAELPDFLAHFDRNGRFLRQAFARFFTPDLMDFFTGLGLELVTERGGRVFPAGGKAPDVLKVLQKWLASLQVASRCTSPVEGLLINNGRTAGVLCEGRKIHADAVILATGGASYPATGSTGDGYILARTAGHTIIPVRPALVPLETAGDTAQKMAGLSLRNVAVRMIVDGKKKRQAFGEIAFTGSGLSGPVTLTCSGEVVDYLREGRQVVFSIDLKPALDETKLDARLQRDFTSRAKERFDSVLRGLLPREMVVVCVDATGIAPEKSAGEITARERRRLRSWIKDFRLEISGYRSFDEAIITAGGVDVREIDPRTMESLRTKGLYVAGELLDIHGDTGGYNLQAAFSTGWLAGRSAALQKAL
jgi:predicted Rossmann fold flavoprotein